MASSQFASRLELASRLEPAGPLSLASPGAAQGPSAGAANINFSGSLLDPARAPRASVDSQATGAALGSVQTGGPKQDAMAQGDKGRTVTAAADAAAGRLCPRDGRRPAHAPAALHEQLVRHALPGQLVRLRELARKMAEPAGAPTSVERRIHSGSSSVLGGC